MFQSVLSTCSQLLVEWPGAHCVALPIESAPASRDRTAGPAPERMRRGCRNGRTTGEDSRHGLAGHRRRRATRPPPPAPERTSPDGPPGRRSVSPPTTPVSVSKMSGCSPSVRRRSVSPTSPCHTPTAGPTTRRTAPTAGAEALLLTGDHRRSGLVGKAPSAPERVISTPFEALHPLWRGCKVPPGVHNRC